MVRIMSNVLIEINGELVPVNTMGGDTIVTNWAGVDIPVVIGGLDLRIWNQGRGEISLAEARIVVREELHLWRQHFYLLVERSLSVLSNLNNMPDKMRNDTWHRTRLQHETTERYAREKLRLAEDAGLHRLSEAIVAGEITLFILGEMAPGPPNRLSVGELPGSVSPLIQCDGAIVELYTDVEEFEDWLQATRAALLKAEEVEGSPEGTAHAKAWLKGNFPPSGDPSPLKLPKVLARYQINLRQSGGVIPSSKALDMRLRRAFVELGVETKKNKPGAGRPRKDVKNNRK